MRLYLRKMEQIAESKYPGWLPGCGVGRRWDLLPPHRSPRLGGLRPRRQRRASVRAALPPVWPAALEHFGLADRSRLHWPTRAGCRRFRRLQCALVRHLARRVCFAGLANPGPVQPSVAQSVWLRPEQPAPLHRSDGAPRLRRHGCRGPLCDGAAGGEDDDTRQRRNRDKHESQADRAEAERRQRAATRAAGTVGASFGFLHLDSDIHAGAPLCNRNADRGLLLAPAWRQAM